MRDFGPGHRGSAANYVDHRAEIIHATELDAAVAHNGLDRAGPEAGVTRDGCQSPADKEKPEEQGGDAQAWQRRALLAATLTLSGLGVVALALLWWNLAETSETSVQLAELEQQLEAERSTAADLSTMVESLVAQGLELSDSLEQLQDLVEQQKATIGSQNSEIARLSNRVRNLEKPVQSESVQPDSGQPDSGQPDSGRADFGVRSPPTPQAKETLALKTPQIDPREATQDGPQIPAREVHAGPAEFLEDLSVKVVGIYQSNGGDTAEREILLRKLLHESVDLTPMSKSILGTHWQQANVTDRARYLSLIESYLFGPMIRLLEDDGVRRMKVLETKLDPESGAQIKTRLETRSGDTHLLGWRISRQEGAFKAVDLRTQGVSLFSLIESELQSYADRNGVLALLETLESRATSSIALSKSSRKDQ